MLKRCWVLGALAVLFLSLSGCKKSEGTKIKNLFGAAPQVSEVSVTKERINITCGVTQADCGCSDGCYGDTYRLYAEVAEDLLTATARVTDATPPSGSNTSDILVVVLRFLVPPASITPPTGTSNQFSLQMFDDGSATLLTQPTSTCPTQQVPIVSGDLTANDGIYTRKVYFATNTAGQSSTCLLETDYASYQHSYSEFRASLDISLNSVTFGFTVQAIDRSGNIATASEISLPIQGTFRDSQSEIVLPCGPPDPSGVGCLPATPPTYP